MSHIVEFSVEGLAGRKGIYSKKLDRYLNVFFGLNGSGKTSLLRILHSAMMNDTSLLSNVPFEAASVTVFSLTHNCNYIHSISAKELLEHGYGEKNLWDSEVERNIERDIFRRAKFQISGAKVTPGEWKVEPDLSENIRYWRHRFLPATRLLHHSGLGRSESVASEDGFDLHFERTLQKHYSDFFGKIQADVREAQQKALADILNAVLNIDDSKEKDNSLDSTVAYQQMTSFLQRQNPSAKIPKKSAFSNRFGQSPLLRHVVSRIDQVEREIEVAMKPRTQLDILVQKLFTGNKSLKFGPTSIDVVTDEDTKIGLRSLSSGEKHILRILLETVQSGESSLLIDEPEMSLHLDWQRGLIDAMRELNSDAQFILATHSPEVMADVYDSNIFEL